jgi:serine/threonine-protein kinase
MVDWFGARALARWMSDETGLRWRLPTGTEREKAARGVDGRVYPWGRFLDPTFCCYRGAHVGRWMPSDVQSFPHDVSVYGVRGVAGNVMDWCLDPHSPDGEVADGEAAELPSDVAGLRVHRGGRWNGTDGGARCATRMSSDPRVRTSFLGVRLVRDP